MQSSRWNYGAIALAGWLSCSSMGLVSQAAEATSKATSKATIAYRSTLQVTRMEVSLSRRLLILYQGERPVREYAIGIGRPGWETPIGDFRIVDMKRDPRWISPFTNQSVAGSDPRNPLNGFWIGFSKQGNNWVGFHGTLNPDTVGKAASHGCLHMYRQDLNELFSLVDLGTPVRVVR